jgi:hypothetical protein
MDKAALQLRLWPIKHGDVMGLLKIRKLTVVAGMLALCAAQQIRGKSAYLKQIGPPPLRFSAATPPLSFALPPMLAERPAPTNSTEIAVPKPNPVETNTVALTSTPIPSVTTNLPAQSSLDLPNNLPRPASASDMLVVSPQMLTEFFKPGLEGTNSATPAIVPEPVWFTPPLATPSSQAIYNRP